MKDKSINSSKIITFFLVLIILIPINLNLALKVLGSGPIPSFCSSTPEKAYCFDNQGQKLSLCCNGALPDCPENGNFSCNGEDLECCTGTGLDKVCGDVIPSCSGNTSTGGFRPYEYCTDPDNSFCVNSEQLCCNGQTPQCSAGLDLRCKPEGLKCCSGVGGDELCSSIPPNCTPPADDCPDDPNKTIAGTCGCGVAETDTDSDGTPDCTDECDNDASKTIAGTCGCGVAETDTDSDGTPDCTDTCPSNSIKSAPGICGCNTPDTDIDRDGAPDCIDECPDNSSKITPGLCGCGASDTDTDSDGTPNCNDKCPQDKTKTVPGICGCGIADIDTDLDGTLDCNDKCPEDKLKIDPEVCGCGVLDNDLNKNEIPDCKEIELVLESTNNTPTPTPTPSPSPKPTQTDNLCPTGKLLCSDGSCKECCSIFDCPTGKSCNFGICEELTTDSTCDICKNGKCPKGSCCLDSDCKGANRQCSINNKCICKNGFKLNPSGKCVEIKVKATKCKTNKQCSNGFKCNKQTQRCEKKN